MNNDKIDRIAKNVIAYQYRLIKDVKTKRGAEFKRGDRVKLTQYNKSYPYTVKFERLDPAKAGETMSLLVQIAYKYVTGMPKPPGMRQLGNWMEEGRAKAVDGKVVELDGTSPSGAPSWLLVLGLI